MSGRVIWITGLSSAGKSTVATALARQLGEDGTRPVVLDGDTMRSLLPRPQGYDLDDRRRLATYYADLARELAGQGHVVIVATVSLLHEIHTRNRRVLPGYLEVFLDVPESVRTERDTRGIYAMKRSVGVDLLAELPTAPDLAISNHGTTTPQGCAMLIAQLLKERHGDGQ
jgi:adenylylsulfate kinase-like enzyme